MSKGMTPLAVLKSVTQGFSLDNLVYLRESVSTQHLNECWVNICVFCKKRREK